MSHDHKETSDPWRKHCCCFLKGTVHPKYFILSSFTQPQVVPNLYEFLCSAEHKGRYFEESLLSGCFGAPLTSIVGQKMPLKSMVPQSCSVSLILQNIFLLCSEQIDSYRFGTTWGWVNDDRIFIFGCTVPLRTGCWRVQSDEGWETGMLEPIWDLSKKCMYGIFVWRNWQILFSFHPTQLQNLCISLIFTSACASLTLWPSLSV